MQVSFERKYILVFINSQPITDKAIKTIKRFNYNHKILKTINQLIYMYIHYVPSSYDTAVLYRPQIACI